MFLFRLSLSHLFFVYRACLWSFLQLSLVFCIADAVGFAVTISTVLVGFVVIFLNVDNLLSFHVSFYLSKSVTDKPRLIFGNRRSYVAMCDLTRKEGFKIIEKVESVTGIDVDVKNGYVFWADTTRNALMKSVLDHRGELLSTENITDKYVFTPEGLAFDWITNKLYWIDSQLRKIEVIDLAGKHRYLVVKTGLDKPRSLVLHPKTR